MDWLCLTYRASEYCYSLNHNIHIATVLPHKYHTPHTNILNPHTALSHRHRPQMPILIVLGLEKRITQRYSLDTLHVNIIHKVRVNVKENRHVDRLARVQPLLLKAKALNLAEIGRHLPRRDRVCGHSDNILIGLVGRGVESQRGFAGEHAHFALLGNELPGQDVRDRAVEGDADARMVLDGLEALGGVAGSVAAVPGGFDGLTTPSCLLADLKSMRILKC